MTATTATAPSPGARSWSNVARVGALLLLVLITLASFAFGGVEKSALVRELVDHHLAGARVIIGRCDDLFAPRPLGPLADGARGRPGPLADALAAGDPGSVFDVFLEELSTRGLRTVVVLEDLQWADEATLDLLRFVARRLEMLPCLVLATHRDDLAARTPCDAPSARSWGRPCPGSTSRRSPWMPSERWSATGGSTRCRSTPAPAGARSSSSRPWTPQLARCPPRSTTSSWPALCRSAAALGAWRQAADLYGQAVEHLDGLGDDDRRRLLEARATTCLHVELVDEAVAAGEQAWHLIAATGDDAALGAWECWLSNAYRAVGRMQDVWAAAERAIERMEPLRESPGLARALGNLAVHQLAAGRFTDCIENGRRGFEMAERFGIEETAVSALNSYGTALSSCTTDVEGASGALHAAIDRADRAGLPDEVARAAINLASALLRMAQPAQALAVIDQGVAAAEANELHYRLSCLHSSRAELLLMLGPWTEAAAEVTAVLRDPTASQVNRCLLLPVLGRIRTRRSDGGAVEVIEEGLTAALRYGEAQIIAAARIARSEAAWLAGDLTRAAAGIEASLPLADLLDPGQLRDLARRAARTCRLGPGRLRRRGDPVDRFGRPSRPGRVLGRARLPPRRRRCPRRLRRRR